MREPESEAERKQPGPEPERLNVELEFEEAVGRLVRSEAASDQDAPDNGIDGRD